MRDFENLGETVMALHEHNLQAGDYNELLKPRMNLPTAQGGGSVR